MVELPDPEALARAVSSDLSEPSASGGSVGAEPLQAPVARPLLHAAHRGGARFLALLQPPASFLIDPRARGGGEIVSREAHAVFGGGEPSSRVLLEVGRSRHHDGPSLAGHLRQDLSCLVLDNSRCFFSKEPFVQDCVSQRVVALVPIQHVAVVPLASLHLRVIPEEVGGGDPRLARELLHVLLLLPLLPRLLLHRLSTQSSHGALLQRRVHVGVCIPARLFRLVLLRLLFLRLAPSRLLLLLLVL
mmetsp:Transcript_34532/g.108243  ORF Transcript_34532/g.108243 Transcript_34532/m.108243 type:complete len:246 (+) Transcript_34532:286-1023(+)